MHQSMALTAVLIGRILDNDEFVRQFTISIEGFGIPLKFTINGVHDATANQCGSACPLEISILKRLDAGLIIGYRGMA